MERLPSSIRDLIRTEDFSNRTIYFGVLLSVYEHFYIQDYHLAYMQYRTRCPFFIYCISVRYINKEIPGNPLPTPFDIFGSDCQCSQCYLVCDNCQKTTETYSNNTVLVPLHRGFVVHHKEYSYGATPYHTLNWYKSYGILCRSCNSRFRVDFVQQSNGTFKYKDH